MSNVSNIQTLSSLDRDEPTTEQTPVERPGKFNEEKFDSIAAEATKHIPEVDAPEPKVEHKGLDHHLEKNITKWEKTEGERKSFTEARGSIDALQERYGDQASLSETLDRYIWVARRFKESPHTAIQDFTEAYAKAGRYALRPDKPKEKPAAVEIDGRRNTDAVMSAIIDGAIDNAGREKWEFTATEAQRAALNELIPGRPFHEQMAIIDRVDRDAFIDPYAVALSLGVSLGNLPVSERQLAQQQERQAADTLIGRAEKGSSGDE